MIYCYIIIWRTQGNRNPVNNEHGTWTWKMYVAMFTEQLFYIRLSAGELESDKTIIKYDECFFH